VLHVDQQWRGLHEVVVVKPQIRRLAQGSVEGYDSGSSSGNSNIRGVSIQGNGETKKESCTHGDQ